MQFALVIALGIRLYKLISEAVLPYLFK